MRTDFWDLEERYGNKLRFAGIRTPSKSEMKRKAGSGDLDIEQENRESKGYFPSQAVSNISMVPTTQVTTSDNNKSTLGAGSIVPESSNTPAQGILQGMVDRLSHQENICPSFQLDHRLLKDSSADVPRNGGYHSVPSRV